MMNSENVALPISVGAQTCVLFLGERCVNGFTLLPGVKMRGIDTIFLPGEIEVYGRKFPVNKDIVKTIPRNFGVIDNIENIRGSFLVDISPYVSFIMSRSTEGNFADNVFNFIKSSVSGLSGKSSDFLLLYVLSDRYLGSQAYRAEQLFGNFLLRNIVSNSNLGGVNDCILYNQGNEDTAFYLRQNNVNSSPNFVLSIFSRLRPNIDISSYAGKEDSKNTPESPDNQKTDNENPDKTLFHIDQGDKKEIVSFEKLASMISRTNSTEGNLQKSVQENEYVSRAIIDKIESQQFDENREIPVVEEKDLENFSKVINTNNVKMFPFLNATKQKNNNVSDTRGIYQNDNSTNEHNIMESLANSIKTADYRKKRDTLDYIRSKLESDPRLLEKASELFKKGEVKSMLSYINEDKMPYVSRIYPTKGEVNRRVMSELDNWSEERGYSRAVDSDRVLTSSIITNNVVSNMHRVMAQKQLTWNTMPQEIEKYITKLLDDNGFTLVDVSMQDKEPPITQIEPTYKTEIKIRVRNRTTRNLQTLVFDVPTLIEGKYHISGGIKWLFPAIVATLPIFVVRPGKVQFRTGYTSLTFQHRKNSLSDSVSVFVGGCTMTMGVWLMQFKSVNEIAKDLGFTITIYDSKKDAKNDALKVVLPVTKKVLGISITNGDNSKLIKGFAHDLQSLVNKLVRYNHPIDLDSTDRDSEYIQLYASTRKNISYTFDKIKRYTIDRRTQSILEARGIKADLYDVSRRCCDISINDIKEERLGINNINIRLMDMIPTEIEKALHSALADYKRKRLINPDAKLVINSGWVMNKLREQSVLQLYKDGNLTIENAQLTGVRLVGPGGFAKADMIQNADKNIVADHFGVLDPVDTAEGNPGIQLSLTTGFEYDPESKIFSEVRSNNTYKHLFGTPASQVPFVAHDDGNRVQFGGSQGRQAVPIVSSESPLVGTGMETYLPSYASSKFVKRSPVDGVVSYIDDKIIIVRNINGKSFPINIAPSDLQTGAGKFSGLEHTPTVKVGDKVSRNQNLVTNQFIKPAYSAGSNVLVCYKPEGGYTFEDGIVVSESFAKKFTSLHYQKIDVILSNVKELIEFPLYKLKRDGNMTYHAGDTIVKTKKIAFADFSEDEIIATVDCRVVDIEIFPADHSFDDLVRETEKLLYSNTNNALKSSGLRPARNSEELILNSGKFEFRKDKLESTLIRIKLIEYRGIGLGDKLTNRHGAKGVVTQILPDDQMPVIPDGRHVDLCLNPMSVISRMNMGQLMEVHVGNILDAARKWLDKNRGDTNKCVAMLNKLYELLDGYEDKRLSRAMSDNLNNMNENDKRKVIEDYISRGIRMIFPPFQSPSLGSINEAAKLVGTELESVLYLPKYNRKSMHPITWGVLYILKLEHISSIKQNTRSIGRSISTTMMPGKPGGHKNAIRMGEQDSWAYAAYAHGIEVLKEMFYVNGDNPVIKTDIIRRIEENGSADFDPNNYENVQSGSSSAFNVFSLVAGLEFK